MIQRIQTLFLLLAIAANAGFFFTPLFTHILKDPTGWISATNIAAILFSSVLSLYSIFLFKNRKKQVYWVKVSLIFEVVALASALGVLFSLGGIGSYLLDEGISFLLLIACIVLQYLAMHYIIRDEKLVKSMDRIR